ncbi:hypothetical protein D917_03345 [Trichinella nativa]|uniref:Uncharacterized protein n=1 Tax=Trichinella nativa TaxID=6335 RepID=A0A1Y3E8M9_9BILA|nr:hypothetical protein D917_03345 [Trichinella nativa]
MTTMANDENEMCEKLIELSFAKIVSSKSGRGGTSLRKNLLIVQVLHRAKMEQRRRLHKFSMSVRSRDLYSNNFRQFLQTSSYGKLINPSYGCESSSPDSSINSAAAAADYSSDLADLQDRCAELEITESLLNAGRYDVYNGFSQGSRPTVVPDGYGDSRFSQQQQLAEEMFYASPPYEDYTWSCGETDSAGIECVNSISSISSSSNDVLFSQDQISCNNNNSNKTLKRKTEFNDNNTSQDEISCDCWVLPKRACVGHSLDGGAPVEVASSDEMLAIGNENPDSNFDEFFSFFTPSLPAQVDNSAGHSTDHSLPCPSLLELICES